MCVISAGGCRSWEKNRKKRFPGSAYSEIKQRFSGTRKQKKSGNWSQNFESGRGPPPGMFVKNYRFAQNGHARGHRASGCAWTTVLASAAGRALKGTSHAVCGPRGRSVVSVGNLPGREQLLRDSAAQACGYAERRLVTVPALVHSCLCVR
jgi:hypothetical protein